MNCGQTGHDFDCLCDVVIVEPVPIRYGFDQVWHAKIVRDAMGWDGESGGAALAEFLEALAYGYDATRAVAESDWQAAKEKGDTIDLRAALVKRLRAGDSIIDMAGHFGVDFSDVLYALSYGNPAAHWAWSEERWAAFEDDIRRPIPESTNVIAKRYGLSHNAVARIMEDYGVVTMVQRLDAARAAAWELSRQGLSAKEILARLHADGHPLATLNLAESVRTHERKGLPNKWRTKVAMGTMKRRRSTPSTARVD